MDGRQTNYLETRNMLEENALIQIKKALEFLKQRILEEEILKESVKNHVCIIQSMLKFRASDENYINVLNDQGINELLCAICGDKEERHRVYVMPSYLQGLFEHMCYLCNAIFNLGREDLVIDFVQIKVLNEYQYDQMGNPYLNQIRVIDKFTFAPLIFELAQFNDTYCLGNDKTMPSWLAWETLYSIEWASKESARDFFRKKKELKYNTPDLCEKNAHRLQLHSIRCEVKAICNKDQESCKINNDKWPDRIIKLSVSGISNTKEDQVLLPETREEQNIRDKISSHNRERLDRALEIVLKDVYGVSNDAIEHLIYPQAIELIIEDDIKLRLKVEWNSHIVEMLDLQAFKERIEAGEDIPNTLYNFVNELIDKPGIFMELNYSLGTKVNVKKYLKKIGLSGVLYDLFIVNQTGSKAMLRSKRIILSKIPKAKLKKLDKHLENLRHHKWELSGSLNRNEFKINCLS